MSYLRAGSGYNESEVTLSNPDKNIGIAEEPSRMDTQKAIEDYQADHIPMPGYTDVKFPGKEEQQGLAFLVVVEMERNSDDIMHNKKFPDSLSVADVMPSIDIKRGPEKEFKRVVSDSSDCDFLEIPEVVSA